MVKEERMMGGSGIGCAGIDQFFFGSKQNANERHFHPVSVQNRKRAARLLGKEIMRFE